MNFMQAFKPAAAVYSVIGGEIRPYYGGIFCCFDRTGLAEREMVVMLESERLVFREIEDADFQPVAEIMRDPGVQKIWEHYFSDADVREWIEKRKTGYRENGIDYLLAIDKRTHEIVGQIGLLKELLEGKAVWGLGYILISRYQGNGYATEGARAMAEYAFHTIKAPKIVCDIRPMNQASIAVARRIGMRETGSFIKRYRGKEMPHLIFELQNPKKGAEKVL